MLEVKVTHTTVSAGQRPLACASVENSLAPAGVPGTLAAGPVAGGMGLDGGADAVGAGAGAAGAAVGGGAGGGDWGRSRLKGCSAAAALSYVGLFRDAVGLIGSLIGSPFRSAGRGGLLTHDRCSRCRSGSRWWGWGRSSLNGCGAAAALSYVGLFRDAVGLIGSLIGSPFGSAGRSGLLTRDRCSRCSSGSRWWQWRRSRLEGCSAAAALSYVGLFRDAVGLIGSLIGSPFRLAGRGGLLLRRGVRRQRHNSQDRRAHYKRDLPSHIIVFP